MLAIFYLSVPCLLLLGSREVERVFAGTLLAAGVIPVTPLLVAFRRVRPLASAGPSYPA